MELFNVDERIESVSDSILFNDRELMVRLCIITKGELTERRKNVYKCLVIVGINNLKLNAEFDLKEISLQIKQTTKCELPVVVISSVLHDLAKENYVEIIGDSRFIVRSKPDVPDFSQLSHDVWIEFSKYLKMQYPNFDPHLHGGLKKVLDNILLYILTRFSASKPLENQFDSIAIENFQPLIRHELASIFIHDGMKRKLEQIIFDYFLSKPKVLLDFVYQAYEQLINVDLVIREQELPDHINFEENVKFLLLDSSFLVPALCKTDPKNLLSITLINQCKKSKIPMYYSSRTKSEILHLIVTSKNEVKGLHKSSRKASDNQFIVDFLKQETEIPWSQYVILLDSWEKILMNNSIYQLPEKLNCKIDDEFFKHILMSIKVADEFRYQDRHSKEIDYAPRKRSDISFDHDAYCISQIQCFKEKMILDKSSSGYVGPWYLTYDNLLSFINYSYLSKGNQIGYVIQPRILLNYLLAYSKITFDKNDIENVKIALLRFTARQVTTQLTLDEYSRLVSLKTGFGENNYEVLRDFFISSPLIEELQRSLHYENNIDPDVVTGEIFGLPNATELLQAVVYSREEREMNQKEKDRLIQTIREYSEEVRRQETIIETLDKTKNAPIIVNTSATANVNLNITVEAQVNSLIKLLEKEDAFKNKELDPPPEDRSQSKIKAWLEKIKQTIELSKDIKEDIILLLPFIDIILKTLH